MNKPEQTCVLLILDGWGYSTELNGNAVKSANTPFLDKILSENPQTLLKCHGEAVGLPSGIMGNSEVGHLNIGAGRVVYQDLLRIDNSISDKSFFENKIFMETLSKIKKVNGSLHLKGLLSDGGVHSQIEHLFSLIELAEENEIKNIYIHVILDGRDTPPNSGINYVKKLNEFITNRKRVNIASVCGRYYAMDRDTRWDRVEKAYNLYTEGAGTPFKDAEKSIETAYSKNESDEFVKPVVIVDETNNPVGVLKDNDSVIFFNFRADRAREITSALTSDKFDGFKRNKVADLSDFVCMTSYDEKFNLKVAFPPQSHKKILGEIISEKGLSQFRIAETEKYAHVTYFFNGGDETPFKNEDRCLVPSPRSISTYDEKPDMSAFEVRDKAIERIELKKDSLIVINFANMDMVGHTGIVDAAVEACQVVDECVKDVVNKVNEINGVTLITADHGNAEQMVDNSGNPHTAHSKNPVKFLIVDNSEKNNNLKEEGALCDIAPTILDILGIKKPEEMTGSSLIK